jgi:glyoxylase-like metal-dependent hydrolase (beta-lactamase superfamily II)
MTITMDQEVFPNIYKIEIPLPNSPLKSLNSYLIKGSDRFLIIDTGMNLEECKNKMLSELKQLNVNLKKTDYFITHMHADHIGLVRSIATEESIIYFNKQEAATINADQCEKERQRQEMFLVYLSHGFPAIELKDSFTAHPGYQPSGNFHLNFKLLKKGDNISIGDYSFNCIETPGHSPGHTCLHEPHKKILFSGDHILIDITPNITYWPHVQDSLGEYLESLEAVYSLGVKITLPGHRRIFREHKKRIKEIYKHHNERLKEVRNALKDGPKTAFEVAPDLTWNMTMRGRWQQVPVLQKWFAVGETIAHLCYLESKGLVERTTQENKIIFR